MHRLLDRRVADGAFLAAVAFLLKRYFFGQRVLDNCVAERWARTHRAMKPRTTIDIDSMACKVLRFSDCRTIHVGALVASVWDYFGANFG